jgi:hypothetical protein
LIQNIGPSTLGELPAKPFFFRVKLDAFAVGAGSLNHAPFGRRGFE